MCGIFKNSTEVDGAINAADIRFEGSSFFFLNLDRFFTYFSIGAAIIPFAISVEIPNSNDFLCASRLYTKGMIASEGKSWPVLFY